MKAIFNKNNLIYFLLLFALLPQLIQLDSEWNMMDGDDAQYIIHARSLIENQVYNDHKLIYTPIPFYGSKSAQPGWPLILVPFVFIFGVNLLKLKIIVIVLALASGVVLLNIIKKMRDGCWLSYYITAIYFFSMTTIVFSRVLYTEWPYLFFSLIIIYQLIKEHRELSSTRKTVLIGLFIGLLFLFRSVAICMLLAVIAIIIQNKMIHERKIWIGLKSICIILIIAAGTHEAVSFMVKPEKSQDYTEQFLLKDINFYEEGKASFLDVVERIPQNGYSALKGMEPTFLGRNWHEYIEYVSPKAFKITQVILLSSGTLLTIFILIGFISEVIRGPTVIEYYTFFYSGLMSIVWFHYEVYRYLMPIVPFLFFYFFIGIYRGLNRIMKQSERVKPLIKKLAIVFLVINIAHAGVEIYRYKFSSQNAKTIFKPYHVTVSWLKENIQSNEIIIAEDPRWYALETELYVTLFPITRDENIVYDYIAGFPNTVIVFDDQKRFNKICLAPVLEKYRDQFRLVKEIDHIKIYRHQSENMKNEGRLEEAAQLSHYQRR